MLITISRQYGAGGSEVARLVAARLGWTVVDNDIVDRVAQRAGLAADVVKRQDERVPGFVERLARALTASSQEYAVPELGIAVREDEPSLVHITERVVHELADEGRVVLVGRAAPAVLGTSLDALHVKLVAPRDFRIRFAQQAEGLDHRAAEKMMDETDANRARYYREYYGRDWDDPTHFHMLLNTGLLGIDEAVAIVVREAEARGWTRSPTRG
ncbi:MAG TPA: cytidylate kinase-like family protein [Gemmatimonadales bacterium]|nr:cytidylate kinase-like family protein [Gemmatimonadales bacterium]